MRTLFINGMIIALTLSTGVIYASPAGESTAPARLEKPLTLSYHSHWFLIGGGRAAYRLGDAYTEVNAFIGQSVVQGCGIQAPKCVQGPAFNVGYRRYLSDSAFSLYAGSNLHWIVDGIRGTDGPVVLVDASLGFNHQTRDRFNWGLGYSLFAFDENGGGFDVEYGGWILSELGWSF